MSQVISAVIQRGTDQERHYFLISGHSHPVRHIADYCVVRGDRRHRNIRKNQKIALIFGADGSVLLNSPRYGSVSDLRGAAGQLGAPLNWHEMTL